MHVLSTLKVYKVLSIELKEAFSFLAHASHVLVVADRALLASPMMN